MNQTKTILWITALAIFSIAGCYLSGYILLAMLKPPQVVLEWHTWFKYFGQMDTARVAPFASKIKTAGLMGFGLPLVVLLVAGFLAGRSRTPSIHGDARFANNGDLSKVGFYKPTETSVVVGKKDGKLLHFSGQQFVILAAPTRSGKGVGIVIPNLLSYQGSMVVLDIKQENFDLTSGYRHKELGQEVFLFNPFAEDGRTHRWNPLSYVSDNPHHRVSDLSSIAAMLYPDAGADQKFWVAQARNAFLAFALFLFDTRDMERTVFKLPPESRTKCTLGQIFRLSSGNGMELKPYFQALSQTPHLSEACKTAFAGLLSQAEETFSSIMGTFKEPLNPWINPIVDAATSADDFLLTDVRKKKMTVYIGILPNKLAESRLIVNLLFSQLINLNTKELPQSNPDVLKHQCLLLMDEFTSIGKVDIIATAVSYMAGYNIRLLPIIQSMAQLDAVYGKEQARTLITNHAMQIIYAPREQQDANDYSDMLGYTTVRREHITRSREISRSEVEERRALMLPQELKAMGPDREVFLFEGIPHPVQCDKIKYYQDKLFTKRLIGKTNVPVLDLSIKQPPKAVRPTKQAQPAPQTEQTETQSDQTIAAIEPNEHTLGDDDMNLKQLAAVATLMGAVATGACSPESLLQPTHNSAGEKVVTGEAFEITKNPNPQKAYKLKVTIKDAPAGGFKDFGGYVSFDIGNIKECGYYLGGAYQGTVPGVGRGFKFPLTKLSDTEYEGVFYTDWGKEGDFFGKGVCHWRFMSMGVGFRATGAEGETTFLIGVSSLYDETTGELRVKGTDDELDSKHSKTQTRFYPKSEYPKSQFHNTSSSDSGLKSVNEYTEKYRNNLFSITLTTEEMK